MKQFLIGLACIGWAAAVSAQDSLTAARDLYASASYDEALVMLTELRGTSAPATIVEQVDQYRAFCLFALGRNAEARKVAEGLISTNPLLQLDRADASPRITAMFTDVRRTLLPTLVRERYKVARTNLESNDLANAMSEFVTVKAMLEEADRLNASDQTMSDMALLVDGFLDLTRNRQALRPESSGSSGQALRPGSSGSSGQALRPGSSGSSGQASVAAALPETAPPVAARADLPEAQARPENPPTYDITASDVSAPVVVVQNLPAIPPALLPFLQVGRITIMMDVVIDERGEVERVVLRNSRYPIYDQAVLRAARDWRYQPALKDGMPVKFLKTIAITLQK
jgi:TonB family protein